MEPHPNPSRHPRRRLLPPTQRPRRNVRGPGNRRPTSLPAICRHDRCTWGTPGWLIERLNGEFHFTLDAAATAGNALCRRYYTAEDDALAKPWRGRVWCNPPYSRVGEFVAKAWEEVEAGRAEVVVLLVPSRKDTRWWHDYVEGKAEVRFIRGRLKFSGSKNSAPFPSALLVLRRERQP